MKFMCWRKPSNQRQGLGRNNTLNGVLSAMLGVSMLTLGPRVEANASSEHVQEIVEV